MDEIRYLKLLKSVFQFVITSGENFKIFITIWNKLYMYPKSDYCLWAPFPVSLQIFDPIQNKAIRLENEPDLSEKLAPFNLSLEPCLRLLSQF